MTHVSLWAIMSGGSVTAGIVLIFWIVVYRPDRLALRVLPHVSTRSGIREATSSMSKRIGALWSRVVEAVGSTRSSVERRLNTLGNASVADFRLQQIQWASLGGLTGITVGLALLARGGSVIVALVSAVLGIIGGATAADSALSRRADTRRQEISAELPDAVELLALAVGSGESIQAALERMTGLGSGAVHSEFTRTLADVRSGTALTSALVAMADRTQSASMTRFTDAVGAAIEQGSGLTRTLHEQARDSRDASRRALLEQGGKAEIRMMIPVIFLILPVTVLFTLFPGLAALDFL